MKKSARYFLLLASLLVQVFVTSAQEYNKKYVPRNTAFLEFGGNSQTLISLSYSRSFYSNKMGSFSLVGRSGIGTAKNRYDKKTIFSVPVEVQMFLGSKSRKCFYEKMIHYMVVGIGWTPHFGTSNLNDTLIPIGHKSNYDHAYCVRSSYRFVTVQGAFMEITPLLLILEREAASLRYTSRYSIGLAIGFYF